MAGGTKKKKKPAANPARGFATTSVASKGKTEKSVDTSNDASETSSTLTAPTSVASQDVLPAKATTASPTRELHELSPEELEAQLEHSDLQNAVEQQGPKVQKESSRQVTRLQTDRRVLRSQSEDLIVREWLPEELMQQILELTAGDVYSVTVAESNQTSQKRASHDVSLARIWQLYRVLSDIDVSEDRTRQALEYILAASPPHESSTSIWGLPEVLEWLALHTDSGELLEYEAAKPKLQARVEHDVPEGKRKHPRAILFPFSYPDFLRFIGRRNGLYFKWYFGKTQKITPCSSIH